MGSRFANGSYVMEGMTALTYLCNQSIATSLGCSISLSEI